MERLSQYGMLSVFFDIENMSLSGVDLIECGPYLS